MYMLRHPRLRNDPDDQIFDDHGSLFASTQSMPPCPSLPGLAFAIVAASLPLLQTRNGTYAAPVARLVARALPIVVEPKLWTLSSGDNSYHLGLSNVDRSRLQHLLNRMEQVCTFCSAAPHNKRMTLIYLFVLLC